MMLTRPCIAIIAAGIFIGPLFAEDKNGVSANTISLPSGPGSIEGLGEAFQPTLNTGTGKHSIGIQIPPGSSGHAPGISLIYEGGDGNGSVGFGWQLPMAYVQLQTDKGIPLYDGQDRFINELREELVPTIQDTHTNYFCRNEGSFVRYRKVGDHWEAREPDGTRLIFGQSSSARIADNTDSSRVFRWFLEERIDPNGNTIRYRFTSFPESEDTNQVYCTAIEYGAGRPEWNAFHFVSFKYEQRDDWFEDCRSGFPIRTGRRLAEIVVGTQGVELADHTSGDFNGDGMNDFLNRRYELLYLPSAPVSLLESVTIFGANNTLSLPPSRYEYTMCFEPTNIEAPDEWLGAENTPPLLFDNSLVDFVDMNGDALPDMLRTISAGSGHQVYYNQGEGEDADGRFIRWSDGELIESFHTPAAVSLQLDSSQHLLADFDGDGASDFVQMTPSDTYFYRNIPTNGFAAWGERTRLFGAAPPSPFGSGANVRTGDFNFDKRIDIIRSLGNNGYDIWFNLLSDEFSGPVRSFGPSYDLTRSDVKISDVNGDRLLDIARIRPGKILFTASLGHGNFLTEREIVIPDFILSAAQIEKAALQDVNGDGVSDLVIDRPVSREVWYWPNRGNGTFGNRVRIHGLPSLFDGASENRWVDVNGNGTTDLVIARNGSFAAVDLGRLMGCVPKPYLLNRVENGIGRVEEIDYATSVDFAVEDGTADDGSYHYSWPHALPFPVTVIEEIRTSDSLGDVYTNQFKYHDGYYDSENKQFRGFARVEQIELGDDTVPTLISTSTFDVGEADEVLKGKLLGLVAEDVGGVYQESITEWTVKSLHDGVDEREVHYAHPANKSTLVREQDRGTPRNTFVEFEYDQYGNQTVEKNYGVVEGEDFTVFNDERLTYTDFAFNLEEWLIRYPKEVRLTDAAGTVINRRQTFYDDPSFAGDNLGVVTVGNATLAREWVDIAKDEFVESSRIRYDAFGNPISIYDPLWEESMAIGHWREIAFDPHLQTYPETETIHIDGAVASIVMVAGYDFGLGTVLRSQDFNQNVTRYAYDSFARLASVIKPYDSEEAPTSEYDYLLAQSFGENGVINWTETRLREQAGGSVFVTRSFVDGLGRKRMEKQEAEEAGEYIVMGATTFNARRERFRSVNPYASSSFDFEIPDPGEPFSETHYDGMLRSVIEINQDGSSRRNVYEPLLVRRHDENDNDPESKYVGTPLVHHNDGLDRLVRVDETVRLDDEGNESAQLNAWTTRYTYRTDDKLLEILDSQNNLKVMEYDGLARLTFMDDPDRGIMNYVYDDVSNLIQTTDAKEQTIKYTYDGVNRIQTEDYLDEGAPFSANHLFDPLQSISTNNRPDVAYFYDRSVTDLNIGDGTVGQGINPLGQLCYVWDLTGEEHFSYDARGRMEWQVKRIPDTILTNVLVSWQTRYDYDSLDRVTRLTYPDSDRISYGYNNRNLLEHVTGGPSGFIIQNIDYRPSAQLEKITYGNDVETKYDYDSRLRLRDLDTDSPVAGKLINFGYTFDFANNITRIDDHRDLTGQPDAEKRKNTQVFQYDDLYRLTQVEYPSLAVGDLGGGTAAIDYRYDRIGNMLKKESNIEHLENGRSVTHLGNMSYGGVNGATGRAGRGASAAGPHALSGVSADGGRSYPYDPNGNMTNIDGLECSWDFKDRMVAAENDKMTARYHYDYTDRRIIKEVRSKTASNSQIPNAKFKPTQYINKFFELRPDDPPVKYVWSGDTRVARIITVLDEEATKTQRLRLHKGWNLTSLIIDTDTTALDPSNNSAIDAGAKWNEAGNMWEATGLDSIPPQTPVWLHANQDEVFGVNGERAPPVNVELAPGKPAWVPNTSDGPIDIDQVPEDASLWSWDATESRWNVRMIHGDGLITEEIPDSIESGSVFYALSESGGTVESVPEPEIQIRYYHQDHLGSSSVISQMKGMIVEEVGSYPYGAPRYELRTTGVEGVYAFTQKEQDSESSLHYFEARYLQTAIGRFLSVDPLSKMPRHVRVAGMSARDLYVYSYGYGNPLAYVDPSGLSGIAIATGLTGDALLYGVGDKDAESTAFTGLSVANILTIGSKPLGAVIMALDPKTMGDGELTSAQLEAMQIWSTKKRVISHLMESTKSRIEELKHRLKPLESMLQNVDDNLAVAREGNYGEDLNALKKLDRLGDEYGDIVEEIRGLKHNIDGLEDFQVELDATDVSLESERANTMY